MHRFAMFLVMACFATFSRQVAAVDVYLVAGQSNGWRLSHLGAGPDGKSEHRIYYFPMDCGSRPTQAKLQVLESLHKSIYGYGLGDALLNSSKEDIVIVQYCVCGTSLHDKVNWYPGDDPAHGKLNQDGLYASFMETLKDVRRQIEAEGLEWNVKALFWHQGEADANQHAASYEVNLRHLFGRFRTDLGADLPIIAGHIRPLNENHRAVNAAMDAVASADPLVAVVATDDLPFESATDVHFKTPGCHELGRRMVAAYQKMQP